MSYLMKYTGNGVEKPLTANGRAVYWRNGDTRWIEDEVYNQYENHTDVFSKIQGPDIEDVLVEGADALAYVTASIATPSGQAAVKGVIDTTYVNDIVKTRFPGAYSTGYINFSGVAESGMSVTIGSLVYTEADAEDLENGVFTNGASAAESATSLIAAINGDTRAAVPYTAAADVSGDGLWLFADTVGDNDALAITTVPSNLDTQIAATISFSDVAEPGMAVTINGVAYTEADAEDLVNGIWTNGESNSGSADSLVTAINNDTRDTVLFTAYKVGNNSVCIKWDDASTTTPFVLTETSAANCEVFQANYLEFSAAAPPLTGISLGSVAYQEADIADEANGVWTNGASASDSASSLIAAINNDTRDTLIVEAVTNAAGDGLWLTQAETSATAAAIEIDTVSSVCAASPITDGAASAVKQIANITHTVTATEFLAGAIDIPLPFVPTSWTIQVFGPTGAPSYFTDLVTLESEPDLIRITQDGATNIVGSDVIHLVAIG